MYVDDALFGADSIKDALEVRDQFTNLLSHADFHLHKWAANDPKLLTGISPESCYADDHQLSMKTDLKALGMVFNPNQDVFKINYPNKEIQHWDKRSILSFIGSFFDPLGLAGPIVVRAKQFLQDLWRQNLDWTSPIPEEFLSKWIKFHKEILEMPTIQIQRHVMPTKDQVEIIGFCDASSKSYGACIYVRTFQNGKATMNLLCSKSKIAPMKNELTIPKLELNAAVLLAKLFDKVKQILANVKITAKYLLSDSKVTLCWIKSNKESLPVYVKNRIQIINNVTSDCIWSHIDGATNPADVLSRGCSALVLAKNDLWWHGPHDFLDPNYHPQPFTVTNSSENTNDTFSSHLACLIATPNEPELLKKYSSWIKLQRVHAWILRFYNNCKNSNNKNNGNLSVSEIQQSKYKIVSLLQHEYFKEEIHCINNKLPIKSNLKSLVPFLDANNVLRVTGRLQNANIPYAQKHPMILPKKCFVTSLIIQYEHKSLLHGGLKDTISSLAQTYWIINCNKEVSKIIGKCITCYRFKAQAASQLMGSLPFDRVNEAKVFDVIGIDYCGPFSIKQSSLRRSIVTKGYVCVFVCFATKAIHLELVSDMTTPAFIAALKRFTARRGYPSKIFCDNAKTFIGADNSLKELSNLSSKEHQDYVTDYAVSKKYRL
ncbi:uncharacterized protein LOC133516552 isoform X1 [Cydia pomonella]|uniref:uncharacterized protein LOC133516552 isoform X1 n=1 Tax=Cydia pomonella TaxID=82600 RepID=UPI002ADD3529|nr:uncharacterized protein LOC133516552 isoform X1 [Cydia pomonella]